MALRNCSFKHEMYLAFQIKEQAANLFEDIKEIKRRRKLLKIKQRFTAKNPIDVRKRPIFLVHHLFMDFILNFIINTHY